ncbi:hypothetical protein ACIRL3_25700 [Streptomyces sp. NPDC102384]|uniref:hypothetical protein n=1 Tax=Streptomyces sp. NPDC102384 TaxID=3366166 RepID=UPI003825F8A6
MLPPDGDMFSARIGYLITTGPTAAVAKARSTEAYRHLTVHITVGQERGLAA